MKVYYIDMSKTSLGLDIDTNILNKTFVTVQWWFMYVATP